MDVLERKKVHGKGLFLQFQYQLVEARNCLLYWWKLREACLNDQEKESLFQLH